MNENDEGTDRGERESPNSISKQGAKTVLPPLKQPPTKSDAKEMLQGILPGPGDEQNAVTQQDGEDKDFGFDARNGQKDLKMDMEMTKMKPDTEINADASME